MILLLDPSAIRERRLELGLTQAQLARLCGVSQAYIARIEKGDLDPKLSTFKRILSVLQERTRERVPLRDVMSAPVVAAKPEDTIKEAVRWMTLHGYSQLPVLRNGVPVGTLTERIVMHKMADARDPLRIAEVRVEEIMNSAPPALSPDSDIDTALGILESYPMVLVMERGEVTGIVTRADVLRIIERRK